MPVALFFESSPDHCDQLLCCHDEAAETPEDNRAAVAGIAGFDSSLLLRLKSNSFQCKGSILPTF